MTENCRIRLMVSTDLEQVLSWRNSPSVRRYMLTQHEISMDEHRQWFEFASHDPMRRLLIVEEGDIGLGFVQFKDVSPGGVADWGFYASPVAPKGAGIKLGTTALDFAFCVLGLHKVCGQALASNEASIGFHRKLGFQQEGKLRHQHRIDGAYLDLICFGLLHDEWPAKN
jgi:UDP-4-amino-4,6-dideoxy-N-acetyl-beta-L-altrosamine N-acetyltransferase